MVSTPPDIQPNGRYSATETAVLLGISRKTLLRWAQSGRIKQRLSRATSRARYAGKDILSLWQSEI